MIYSHLVSLPSSEIIWEENNTIPFDELIVSWNALRPQRGRYLISIMVKSDNWSQWLSYAEWGTTRQKTFSFNDSIASSYQDTVQLKNSRIANAFRIKVSALDGADLNHFDSLYAYVTVQNQFKIHPIANLPSLQIPLTIFRSQQCLNHPRKNHLCSPTSLSMAIDYLLGKNTTDPIELAEKVHDDRFDIYGNWILNTAEVFSRLNGRYRCHVERLEDFNHLHRFLNQNLPVVVSIKGPLIGAPLPYQNGHLMLITGWDATHQRVLCADPAYGTDASTQTSYAIHDFINAWARRKNLSYNFGISE